MVNVESQRLERGADVVGVRSRLIRRFDEHLDGIHQRRGNDCLAQLDGLGITAKIHGILRHNKSILKRSITEGRIGRDNVIPRSRALTIGRMARRQQPQ